MISSKGERKETCCGDQRPPFSNRGTSLRRRQTCRLGAPTIQTLKASSIILGAELLNARFGVRRSLHSRSGLCFSRLKHATIVKRHLPVSRIAPEAIHPCLSSSG